MYLYNEGFEQQRFITKLCKKTVNLAMFANVHYNVLILYCTVAGDINHQSLS